MRNLIVASIVAIVVISFFALNKKPELSLTKITVSGSSTIAPLVSVIAKIYESNNPDVRIDVQSGGSSRGIADTRSGLSDIGLVSRSLNKDEQDLIAHKIAMDGISLILNKENPVGELTHQQIVDIYTGVISNWKEIGGKDEAITVVNKAEGRSTLELFQAFFGVKGSQIQADIVIGENEQGIKAVAGNPGAIGYVSIGSAEFSRNQGVPIKLLPLDGVSASTASLRSGEFPISRPLNLVTSKSPSEEVKKFIAFAQSSVVRGSVEAQYFVPAGGSQ
ncbi:MAG: phosphate ABC transporter substrate-binding protein [Ketobacter sp.]|nr:phosphate ABC transporter substrate-binding protein [Planctomycetota bacterium]MCP5015648.1 phosphate ABC transporter substrate-binding protein [Ketobacter sp.]